MSPWYGLEVSPRSGLDLGPRSGLDLSPWSGLDFEPVELRLTWVFVKLLSYFLWGRRFLLDGKYWHNMYYNKWIVTLNTLQKLVLNSISHFFLLIYNWKQNMLIYVYKLNSLRILLLWCWFAGDKKFRIYCLCHISFLLYKRKKGVYKRIIFYYFFKIWCY